MNTTCWPAEPTAITVPPDPTVVAALDCLGRPAPGRVDEAGELPGPPAHSDRRSSQLHATSGRRPRIAGGHLTSHILLMRIMSCSRLRSSRRRAGHRPVERGPLFRPRLSLPGWVMAARPG